MHQSANALDKTNQKKTLPQVKGPPGYRPDNEMLMSTMYNRINSNVRGNTMRARQIRNRSQDNATRSQSPRPITPKEGLPTAPNTKSVNDALKYYAGLIR